MGETHTLEGENAVKNCMRVLEATDDSVVESIELTITPKDLPPEVMNDL